MKDKTLLFIVLIIIAISSGYYVLIHEGNKNKEKIKEILEEEPITESSIDNKIKVSTEETKIESTTEEAKLESQIESTTESKLINTKKMTTQEKLQVTRPKMTINTNKEYLVTLHTSEGDITLKMDAENKPITVNNFIYLANLKFYDDIVFHRVIENFMIQGGDPLGNGTGGPAYKFKDELNTKNENKAGTIAMANSGPNTNGSQFFINTVNNDYLDTKHTVFGEVIEGMDVVKKIEMSPKMPSDGRMPSSELQEPIIIKSVSVEEK